MIIQSAHNPMNFHPTAMDDKMRIYLGLLALRQPFHMDISATPSELFDELETQWPTVAGWEYEAGALQYQIRTLAEPLIERSPDTQLHLSINVSSGPHAQIPAPDTAAVQALFDADGGSVQQRTFSDREFERDSYIEDVPVGMTVLFQQKAA